ncbi:hypothetical protein [Streptomyces sp. T028]
MSIARSELPGLDARIGYLDGNDAEFPALPRDRARSGPASGQVRAGSGS